MKSRMFVGLVVLLLGTSLAIGEENAHSSFRIRPMQINAYYPVPEGVPIEMRSGGYQSGFQINYLVEGEELAGFDSATIESIKTPDGVEISHYRNGQPAYVIGQLPRVSPNGKYCTFEMRFDDSYAGKVENLAIRGEVTVLTAARRETKAVEIAPADEKEKTVGAYTVRVRPVNPNGASPAWMPISPSYSPMSPVYRPNASSVNGNAWNPNQSSTPSSSSALSPSSIPSTPASSVSPFVPTPSTETRPAEGNSTTGTSPGTWFPTPSSPGTTAPPIIGEMKPVDKVSETHPPVTAPPTTATPASTYTSPFATPPATVAPISPNNLPDTVSPTTATSGSPYNLPTTTSSAASTHEDSSQPPVASALPAQPPAGYYAPPITFNVQGYGSQAVPVNFINVEITGPMDGLIDVKIYDGTEELEFGFSAYAQDKKTRIYSVRRPKSGKIVVTMNYWLDMKKTKIPLTSP